MNHQFPLSKTLFHPGLWAGLLLLLLSGAIPNRVAAQTTLAVGDIAFLELSGDSPDRFAFVLLTDIDAGTAIRFTDAGWRTGLGFSTSGENGVITWTATAALPAGNIIQVNIDNTNNAASTNNGTANFGFFTGESNSEFSLAVSGDQIFAWQAPNNDRPTTANFSPIAAINGASTGWSGLISSANALDSNTSDLPSSLTDGVNAVSVGAGPGPQDEWDNVQFALGCSSLANKTREQILPIINNDANWTGSNSAFAQSYPGTSGGCNSFVVTPPTPVDTAPPVIAGCPGGITLYADANCQGTLGDLTGLVNAVDAVDGPVAVTQQPSASTVLTGAGIQSIVVLTATDAAGNAATCTFLATLVDNISPVAVPQNITVYLGGSGAAPITAADVDNGSFDNCALASLSVSPNTFGCGDLGPRSVTLTAIDASGNFDTATAIVTVVDTVSPVLPILYAPLDLPATANCNAILPDLRPATNAWVENCGMASVIQVPAPGTPISGSTTVTFIGLDLSGNSGTATRLVNVTGTSPIQTNISAVSCNPADVGVDTTILVSKAGCDSVVITNTTLLPSDVTNIFATTCDPTQAGQSMDILTNQYGCDSVVITNTTLLASDTTRINVSTCDPSEVDSDTTFLTNQNGCDSLVITNTNLVASPEAPTDLSVNNDTAFVVSLRWKDNSQLEDGFIIYRGLNGATPTNYDTVPANYTFYYDEVGNDEATYQVAAYAGDCSSGTPSTTTQSASYSLLGFDPLVLSFVCYDANSDSLTWSVSNPNGQFIPFIWAQWWSDDRDTLYAVPNASVMFKTKDLTGVQTWGWDPNITGIWYWGPDLLTVSQEIFTVDLSQACNNNRLSNLLPAPQAHRTPASIEIKPDMEAALASMIQVSPNPFNSYVLIEGKGYDQTATYRVFNQLGQQVAVKAGNLSATTKMDLDNLTEGVYLLQVEAFGVSYTQKIVKQ